MKMQSRKWSGSIAVSLVAFLSATSVCHAVDGKTSGQNAGQSALSKFGSKSKVNANISQPMTNSAYQMQSVDGSKSFQATINAPSSDKFLEIMIQPAGSGDLQKVMISQDTNADGTIDYVYNVPRLISGVCANGFISCAAGTWNACTFYLWSADASNRITEVPAVLSDLGGCYCINSSCGSNLVWANSTIVLKALGGGIVGALQRGNPALSISSVSNDPVTITFFGKITNNSPTAASSVTALASSPSVAVAASYYNNPVQLTAARDNIAISQAGDPNSMYYKVTNSATAVSGIMSVCTLDRVFATNGSESINNGCSTFAGDVNCRLKDGTIDGVLARQNFSATGLNPLPSCQTINFTAGPVNMCRDWWHQNLTYVCGQTSYNVADAGTRFGSVVSSSTENGTTLNYTDNRKGAARWSTSDGVIQLGNKELGADCELGCKTKLLKKDTQASASGTTTGVPTLENVTDKRVPAQSYEFFYKACENGTCPIDDPAEQIVTNCQCLNNFNDTAVFVQTLRLSGKDLICSSGAKKPM